MPPPALDAYFTFTLSDWETYGLFFLLGSFTVATLSDLRRLSAQREFLEIWALFVAAMLGLDLWLLDGAPDEVFYVKWTLILVLGVLSWERVGGLFRLAIADVAACAALASILSPGFILVFWVLLKLASFVEGPILRRGRNFYPFLPVVSTAALLVLVVAWYAAPRIVEL